LPSPFYTEPQYRLWRRRGRREDKGRVQAVDRDSVAGFGSAVVAAERRQVQGHTPK